MICKSKTRLGAKCKAHALRGKQHCHLHSHRGRAAQLGSIGGRRRAVFNPDLLQRLEKPTSAKQLVNLLGTEIIELRLGKLDSRLASATAYLSAILLRAISVGDLELRLAALEARVSPSNARVQ